MKKGESKELAVTFLAPAAGYNGKYGLEIVSASAYDQFRRYIESPEWKQDSTELDRQYASKWVEERLKETTVYTNRVGGVLWAGKKNEPSK
jgi:hypothetical protein